MADGGNTSDIDDYSAVIIARPADAVAVFAVNVYPVLPPIGGKPGITMGDPIMSVPELRLSVG